jgi:TonB family protein
VNCEKKKRNGQTVAMAASLLMHCLVLLGFGVGTLPGSAPRPKTMAVYLAMPSVEVFSNPKAEIHADYPANPEPTSLSSLEPNSQELKTDRAEIGIEATSAVALDESNPLSVESEMEKLFPEEGIEPERLPAAEVDSLSNFEKLKTEVKLQTSIETSNSDNPNRIITSAESRLDTDYRSQITDYPSSLLAFAGDPTALGMLARDALGPDLVEAQILSLPEPAYPVLCRKRGEEGRVVIEIEISAKGKVLKARVTSSSSYSRLDSAALKAIQGAAFAPATEYRVPVESTTKVAYRFELEGK